MTTSNKIVIGAVVAGFVLILAWFLLLYQPQNTKLADLDEEIGAAESQETQLRTELSTLEELKKTEPQIDEQLGRAAALMPAEPALAEFIRESDQVATDAGLFYASITPAEPSAQGAFSVISVSVELSGGFFEVIDYLQRMEATSRLVTFDTMQLSPTDSGRLNAQLVGRIFVLGGGAGAGDGSASSESASGTSAESPAAA